MAEYFVFETAGPNDRKAIDVHLVEGAGDLAVSKFLIGVHNGVDEKSMGKLGTWGTIEIPDLADLTVLASSDTTVRNIEQVQALLKGFIEKTERPMINLSSQNVEGIPDELLEGLPAYVQHQIKLLRQSSQERPGYYL